jgi:hypothetical protein
MNVQNLFRDHLFLINHLAKYLSSSSSFCDISICFIVVCGNFLSQNMDNARVHLGTKEARIKVSFS